MKPTYIYVLINLAKVISNRPGVSNPTAGHPVPDVGVYGSNSNLVNNQKINVDSK